MATRFGAQEVLELLRMMDSDARECVDKAVEMFQGLAESPKDLAQALFEIIVTTDQIKARQRAMVMILPILEKNWASFEKDFQFYIEKEIGKMYDKVTTEEIHVYSQIISLLLNISDTGWDALFPFYDPSAATEKDVIAINEIISCLNEPLNITLLSNYMDEALGRVLHGLQQPNWSGRFVSMVFLSNFLYLFPDEYEQVSQHINIVAELAANSADLPGPIFTELWLSISRILSSFQPDDDVKNLFIPTALEAARRTDRSADLRIVPLTFLDKISPNITLEQTTISADLVFEISAQYVREANEIPFMHLACIESGFSVINSTTVYNYITQKAEEFIQKPELEYKVTAMTALKYLYETLPYMVIQQLQKMNEHIEYSLNSGNNMLVQLACSIISGFKKYVAINFLDPWFYIRLLIPHITSEFPDVRFYARNAARNIVCIAKSPIRGLTEILIGLCANVCNDEAFFMLDTIAAAVKNECIYGTMNYEPAANFALQTMGYEDLDISCGGLSIAANLIKYDSRSHKILFDKICEDVSNYIADETIPSLQFWAVGHLLTVYRMSPPKAKEIFDRHYEVISDLLFNYTPFTTDLKQKSVVAISKIAPSLERQEFIQNLIDLEYKWMEDDDPAANVSAIYSLAKIIPKLPIESAQETYKHISILAQKTKQVQVLRIAVSKMATILSKVKELADVAFDLCLLYLAGSIRYLDGVPPIGTDVNFEALDAFSHLFCELLPERNELAAPLTEFCLAICSSTDVCKTEVALRILATIVSLPNVTEESIQEIKNVGCSMITLDTSIILIQGINQLQISLLRRGLVSPDDANTFYPIFQKWWDECMADEARMQSTLNTMSLLIWTYSKNYPQLTELIVPSFQFFPPYDPSQSHELIDTIIHVFNEVKLPENVIIEGSIALCKVIVVPEEVRKKRKISNEDYENCKALVNRLRAQYSEVKERTDAFADQSPHRRLIFQSCFV